MHNAMDQCNSLLLHLQYDGAPPRFGCEPKVYPDQCSLVSGLVMVVHSIRPPYLQTSVIYILNCGAHERYSEMQKVETQVSFLRRILDTETAVEENSNELT
jgi:hypothetical protein